MSSTEHSNLSDDAQKVIKKLPDQIGVVVIEGGEIVFADSDYRIPLDECSSHSSIIRWVLHLNEKSWASQSLICTFIVVALQGNGLET